MTLIDQAKEELIIVSPYTNIRNWVKLTKRLKRAIDRGVEVRWFIREDADDDREQIRQFGIEPIEVERLHCKFYMNENGAVVTSMNLNESSDKSSIDIGYFTDDPEQCLELWDFVDTYLESPILEERDFVGHDEEVHFNALLYFYLGDFTDYFEMLQRYEGKYGEVFRLHSFMEVFGLEFEPKPSYFRICLTTKGNYEERVLLYEAFEKEVPKLKRLIGHDISLGNQMLRFKLDLDLHEHYEFERWGQDEFNVLKPIIDKVITGYVKAITGSKELSKLIDQQT